MKLIYYDPMTNADLKDPVENEWIDILMNGQLRRKIIKLGEKGNRPNASDICTLKIIGKLEDGTVVEEYEELTIQLGDIEVIQGLDLAIALMNIGEIAEVEVGPRFGYGDIGNKPNIPGGAKIFYTVELKAIELEVDLDQLSVHQRQEIGNKKRERGNWWYMRNEPTLAIQCYRRALEYLDDTNGGISYQEKEGDQFASDADLQGLLEDRMKVYNNLAAAQMKCDAYDSAQRSVENVLRCQPQNVKALFRKGKILHVRGEHAQAYAMLQQAAKLDPESKEIQQELVILQKKNAKDAHREKNLYRKMLGTSKVNGVELKKTVTESKNKNVAKVAWSLIGGAAVALAGIFAYRYTS
ncbi:peptidyl-prolyl cis-trans isomerase FKBP8 isoform X2 [Cephus cinctus]|uniref:peptidylprolyl isomerase n=1 Tax=Cephus cinctus TaxID=211228 RepID=A0AAJ7W3S8_CEPCN|nr:peptidyl-prolyl cis-trans isomerase FKBP8 isoform X2 [Cephus cinctus]